MSYTCKLFFYINYLKNVNNKKAKVFSKSHNVLVSSIRNYIKKYKWDGEGIKYPGFTYYPRKPDFEDPKYEATKLFMVQRIKPVKGNTYWEKKILEALKLSGKAGDVAVVKNIPENNALLWKIKHLVRISPIIFANGQPTPEDADRTVLKENGHLIVDNKLKPTSSVIDCTTQFKNNTIKLDGTTLRRNSRMKWVNAWCTDV